MRLKTRSICQFDSIGVGVTGAPLPWPFQATDVWGVRERALKVRLDRHERHQRVSAVALSSHVCAGPARGGAASPKSDWIGVGVTGAQRPWLFEATDARGVRVGALQVRLDRRGRHWRAASVALVATRLHQSSRDQVRLRETSRDFARLRTGAYLGSRMVGYPAGGGFGGGGGGGGGDNDGGEDGRIGLDADSGDGDD